MICILSTWRPYLNSASSISPEGHHWLNICVSFSGSFMTHVGLLPKRLPESELAPSCLKSASLALLIFFLMTGDLLRTCLRVYVLAHFPESTPSEFSELVQRQPGLRSSKGKEDPAPTGSLLGQNKNSFRTSWFSKDLRRHHSYLE